MLVLSVARVHDMRLGRARDEAGRADLRMADDDDVRVVGAECERGVAQRLTLVDRGSGRPEGHRVGGEALRGELEARERARGGLVEQVHDEASPERRELLHLAVERPLEGARRVEDALGVGSGQVGDREQVTARLGAHDRPSGTCSSRTWSAPSVSSSSTRTRSSSAVGRFLPT